jgi:hypothetical protein
MTPPERTATFFAIRPPVLKGSHIVSLCEGNRLIAGIQVRVIRDENRLEREHSARHCFA